jgi:hypothetical protein
MASEATVEVSVEAAIHKALVELAQNILDEHGVLFESSEITWDHSILGKKPQVSEVIIRTRTVHGANSNY